MVIVKICGIRDAATAVEAANAGADIIGIMIAESRRKVTPDECFAIVEAINEARRAPGPVTFDGPVAGEVSRATWAGAWSEAIDDAAWRWRPLIAGVFADQDLQEVNEIAEVGDFDLVQLSGEESPDYVAKVQKPVIKALHIAEQMTAGDVLDLAAEYRCAGFLLDTHQPGQRGGTGEAFDWTLAADASPRLPFLLAGGLTPDNVADAVGVSGPWGVDVSTGVETDRKKDIEKIRAFIRNAKGATNGRQR